MRRLPPATLDAVLPPNREHPFFEDAERFPFEPHAIEYAPNNAWWLAEASLLAYDDPQHATPCFERAGFLRVAEGHTSNSLRYYVAVTETFAIVAFRGTRALKRDIGRPILDAVRGVIEDIVVDANCIARPASGGGCVHTGFMATWHDLRDELSRTLTELHNANPQRTIWLTGHSLGAALATLAAAELPHVAGLYTFGSPAVGDIAFGRLFRVPTYRIVNNNDLVPRLPPQVSLVLSGFYRHVGELKYLTNDGELRDRVPARERIGSWIINRFVHTQRMLRRIAEGELGLLPGDAFADHAPLYYALQMKALRKAAERT